MKVITLATALMSFISSISLAQGDDQLLTTEPKAAKLEFKMPKSLKLDSDLKIGKLEYPREGLTNVHVRRGNEGGGGGDAVASGVEWTLLDLMEPMSANYFSPLSIYQSADEHKFIGPSLDMIGMRCGFQADLKGQQKEVAKQYGLKFSGVFGSPSGRVLKASLQFIIDASIADNGDYGGVTKFNDDVAKAKARFAREFGERLIWIGTNKPLENVEDEGVVRLTDPVTKQQLAIQKDGVVLVYLPIFNRLDGRNRAALVLHEALLRYVLVKSPALHAKFGTAKIRELVRSINAGLDQFGNLNMQSIPDSAFARLCGMNGEAAPASFR
ncbi:MAG: hypothetical protein EOP06_13745 [Proteobacteria bacterium]|nr:MAG: hypothetical protein EOP06_13745 [Pseudomonadota bacterium]